MLQTFWFGAEYIQFVLDIAIGSTDRTSWFGRKIEDRTGGKFEKEDNEYVAEEGRKNATMAAGAAPLQR